MAGGSFEKSGGGRPLGRAGAAAGWDAERRPAAAGGHPPAAAAVGAEARAGRALRRWAVGVAEAPFCPLQPAAEAPCRKGVGGRFKRTALGSSAGGAVGGPVRGSGGGSGERHPVAAGEAVHPVRLRLLLRLHGWHT